MDDEEFDLDNSDDLNRFINKYEAILGDKSADKVDKLDKPNAQDDIEFLVEEELSRNDEKSDTNSFELNKDNNSDKAVTPTAPPKMSVQIKTRKSNNKVDEVTDDLEMSNGSNNESQMFKELFSTQNKGIAGIMDGPKQVSEEKSQEMQVNA